MPSQKFFLAVVAVFFYATIVSVLSDCDSCCRSYTDCNRTYFGRPARCCIAGRLKWCCSASDNCGSSYGECSSFQSSNLLNMEANKEPGFLEPEPHLSDLEESGSSLKTTDYLYIVGGILSFIVLLLACVAKQNKRESSTPTSTLPSSFKNPNVVEEGQAPYTVTSIT